MLAGVQAVAFAHSQVVLFKLRRYEYNHAVNQPLAVFAFHFSWHKIPFQKDKLPRGFEPLTSAVQRARSSQLELRKQSAGYTHYGNNRQESGYFVGQGSSRLWYSTALGHRCPCVCAAPRSLQWPVLYLWPCTLDTCTVWKRQGLSLVAR